MQLKFSEKNNSYLLNVKVNQNLRKARLVIVSKDLYESFIIKVKGIETKGVIKGK